MNDNKKQLKLKDLVPDLLLQFAASFMLFIYAPIQFYFTDVDQFTYDVYDILRYMWPVFAAAFLVSVLIMTLLKMLCPKAYGIVMILYVTAFIATYIQGNYLSGFLPTIDGNAIQWNKYPEQRIISVLLWLLIGAAIVLFYIKKKNAFPDFIKVTSIIGIALMALTIVVCGFTVNKAFLDKYNIEMSDAYMYDMSEDTNFIILLLDSIDATAYEEIAEKHPEYQETFEDFTYFRNTMACYPFTSRSVPYILYGKWFENEQDIYDYSAEALRESPFLNGLKAQNYRVTMYMRDFMQVNGIEDTFDNVTRSEKLADPVKFCKMQIMFAGLRYLPFDLKRYCELTQLAIDVDSTRVCSIGNPYYMTNDWFYESLNSSEVKITNQKQFHYIHILAAHAPFDYGDKMEKIENGTYEDSIQAAMTLTDMYLDKLRASGTYDNSIIIVLADHGNPRGKEEPLDKQNPIMFIKGLNEKHPYAVSNAPVSHEDLQEAYSRLLNGSTSEEAFDWKEGDERARRYLRMVHYDTSLIEFYQYGQAADEETMVQTGVVYPAV